MICKSCGCTLTTVHRRDGETYCGTCAHYEQRIAELELALSGRRAAMRAFSERIGQLESEVAALRKDVARYAAIKKRPGRLLCTIDHCPVAAWDAVIDAEIERGEKRHMADK